VCIQEYGKGPNEANVSAFGRGHLLLTGHCANYHKYPAMILHERWKHQYCRFDTTEKFVAIDLKRGNHILRVISGHLPACGVLKTYEKALDVLSHLCNAKCSSEPRLPIQLVFGIDANAGLAPLLERGTPLTDLVGEYTTGAKGSRSIALFEFLMTHNLVALNTWSPHDRPTPHIGNIVTWSAGGFQNQKDFIFMSAQFLKKKKCWSRVDTICKVAIRSDHRPVIADVEVDVQLLPVARRKPFAWLPHAHLDETFKTRVEQQIDDFMASGTSINNFAPFLEK
jgi:hypothetical protein